MGYRVVVVALLSCCSCVGAGTAVQQPGGTQVDAGEVAEDDGGSSVPMPPFADAAATDAPEAPAVGVHDAGAAPDAAPAQDGSPSTSSPDASQGAAEASAPPAPAPITVRCVLGGDAGAGRVFECDSLPDGGGIARPGSNITVVSYLPTTTMYCAYGEPPTAPCARGTACLGVVVTGHGRRSGELPRDL